MNPHAISITEVDEAPKLWQETVDASESSWIWHTWLAHEFNLCAGEKYKAQDLSFFVYDEKKAVGVVPLIMQEKTIGDFKGLEASYYSGFLPWPCFRADLDAECASELESFAFTELERRAREAGAGRIVMQMATPPNQSDERERVARVAAEHSYLIAPLKHHVAAVNAGALSAARSRYDYKHFSLLFEVTIAEGDAVTAALEETYLNLHVKDAGGQFRSRESYALQSEIARQKAGFYIVARHKESGAVAGMALINVYQGAAYYHTVAIDPDFQKMCVGYQLQCRVLEELLARGIATYDLGPKEDFSTARMLSSEKKRGIALFKDKFARYQSRDLYEAEKFLDEAFFRASAAARNAALQDYFKF
jgi:GNAT superfamily N-acetyltransferase